MKEVCIKKIMNLKNYANLKIVHGFEKVCLFLKNIRDLEKTTWI